MLWYHRYNDDANGILRIYSRDPRALDNGQTVLIEEREHFSLELVVERTGLFDHLLVTKNSWILSTMK